MMYDRILFKGLLAVVLVAMVCNFASALLLMPSGPYSVGDKLRIDGKKFVYDDNWEVNPITMRIQLLKEGNSKPMLIDLKAVNGTEPIEIKIKNVVYIIIPDPNLEDSDVYYGTYQKKTILYDSGELYLDVNL